MAVDTASAPIVLARHGSIERSSHHESNDGHDYNNNDDIQHANLLSNPDAQQTTYLINRDSQNPSQCCQAAEKAVKERFDRLMDAMKHKDESVEAGRKYVKAYVIFVHYVEGLHNTIQAEGAHGHGEEGQGEGHGH